MSMLSMQIEGLREAANCLDEIGISIGHDTTASAFTAHDVSERMRSAAYTIESLRDRLQTSDGQSCYATQANYEHCKYSTDRGWRDTSRYSELFGTPERAARTLAKACGECSEAFPCWECPLSEISGSNVYEPEILEWLRGEGEE